MVFVVKKQSHKMLVFMVGGVRAHPCFDIERHFSPRNHLFTGHSLPVRGSANDLAMKHADQFLTLHY